MVNKKEKIQFAAKYWEKTNPHPKCELFYLTEFQLLVSVVLSAQATDKSVNKAMEHVYKNDFTPETVLTLGVEKFLDIIKSIGLAPTKARNILRLSQLIVEKFSGQVPHTREKLESLPGVGRKTASVVLGELWNQPTLAVDTHVFRVTNRLGLQKEKNPKKAEEKIFNLIPKEYLPRFSHWLVLHGRYICTAKKPKCTECGLREICEFVTSQKKLAKKIL